MMKFVYSFTVIAVSVMLAGTAGAESIKGRFGISGKAGFNVPSGGIVNDSSSTKLDAGSDFATGGGLIYGIYDFLAVEADVTYVPSTDFKLNGQKIFEVETIIPSIGLQLRNNVIEDHLSAYLGGGIDVLFAGPKDNAGNTADVGIVVGGHVNGGGDYFITRNFALNLDLRGIFFGKADIKSGGTTFGKYDPITFVATVGLKWFPW
jgi:outer membrane protein